jgi:hypothetical protein
LQAQVPTEGDAGWISDDVMNVLREEEDRLRVKKMDNLEQYTKEAKAWVLRLWDDIPAQYSWRKTCRAARTFFPCLAPHPTTVRRPASAAYCGVPAG